MKRDTVGTPRLRISIYALEIFHSFGLKRDTVVYPFVTINLLLHVLQTTNFKINSTVQYTYIYNNGIGIEKQNVLTY